MQITVHKSKETPENSAFTGGEYAIAEVNIYVDESLSPDVQRALVIHSVIENYLPSWPHEKVEELTELIIEGMSQL